MAGMRMRMGLLLLVLMLIIVGFAYALYYMQEEEAKEGTLVEYILPEKGHSREVCL